jgi:hypothetical protein
MKYNGYAPSTGELLGIYNALKASIGLIISLRLGEVEFYNIF